MTPLKINSVKKNPLKHQAGLMLIEVLISILIFSIGILGMVGLQTIATQNAANSEFRTIASTLANDIISQMWIKKTANPSDANLSGDITIWKAKVSASTLPNASGTVTLANSITTVTVTWKPPSKKSTENTNQYVTQVSIPN